MAVLPPVNWSPYFAAKSACTTRTVLQSTSSSSAMRIGRDVFDAGADLGILRDDRTFRLRAISTNADKTDGGAGSSCGSRNIARR